MSMSMRHTAKSTDTDSRPRKSIKTGKISF